MVRERVKRVLKPLISGTEFAIIDLTHVLSCSKGVFSSVSGFNSKKDFSSQIHMAFLFSLDHHMPSFFRMVPVSITVEKGPLSAIEKGPVLLIFFFSHIFHISHFSCTCKTIFLSIFKPVTFTFNIHCSAMMQYSI